MNRRLITLASVCVLVAGPAAAQTQVPALIPVQGQLADDQGMLLEGDVALSFALYEEASGGTPFFSASRTVTLDEGAFAVYLGRDEALDLGLLPASGNVYVGLTVDGGEELSPRFQIGAAPFAARAASCSEAQSLQGAAAEDFATVDHGHDFASLTGVPSEFTPAAHGHGWSEITGVPQTFPPSAHGHDWAELSSVPADIADGDSDTLASLMCADGQVPQSDGAGAWACVTSPDPVATVLAADQYVRNSGDAIAGNIRIAGDGHNGNRSALIVESGSDRLAIDGNDIEAISGTLQVNRRGGRDTRFYGDVVVDDRVRLSPVVDATAGRPAPALEQDAGKYVEHNAGNTTGSGWADSVPATIIERYCADIDGCTVVLIEAGFDPAALERRRATPPSTFMVDMTTQRWSIDDTATGLWGQPNPTRAEALSIGRCAFAIDQNLANGVFYDFAVVKEVSDSGGRARVCTLVISD